MHELLGSDRGARTCSPSAGGSAVLSERRGGPRRGGGDRVRAARRSCAGSSRCCSRASASGSPPGGPASRQPPSGARGRGRGGAAAVRGRHRGDVRRNDRGGQPTRRLARRARRRPRPPRPSAAARRASSPRRRRPPGRISSCATTDRWRSWSRRWREVLDKLRAEGHDVSGAARLRASSAAARGRGEAGTAAARQAALRRWSALAVAAACWAPASRSCSPIEDAIKEITLPLRHEDIIRQQARDKNLDPALIAAIIYRESKFRDQTSEAGAKGLMQILPETAEFVARKSGGTEFERGRPRRPADQHLLRLLVPALPARPLRRQPGGGDRGLQRGPRARRPLGRQRA